MRYMVIFVMLCVGVWFVGCGDSHKEAEFEHLNPQELTQILHFGENEKRTFVMKGTFDKKPIKAYLTLAYPPIALYHKDTLNALDMQARITFVDDAYHYAVYKIENLAFHIDHNVLSVKGKWSDKEKTPSDKGLDKFEGENEHSVFILTQDMDMPLNEADVINGSFEAQNKQEKKYYKYIERPIIKCNNTMSVASCEKINTALNDNKDTKALGEALQAEVVKDYDENMQWDTDSIQQQSVYFVDKHIIMLRNDTYRYEGGAHGSKSMNMQAFSVQSGESLPQDIKSLFKAESLVQVRTKIIEYLVKEYGKDMFFNLDEVEIPEVFFMNERGIVFVWQEYDITPYAAGIITLGISYKELKDYANMQSPYGYLFQ